MSSGNFLITLLELAGVIALVWCIFHEDRLVAFEEKLFAAIRRKRLRIVKAERTRGFNNSFNV